MDTVLPSPIGGECSTGNTARSSLRARILIALIALLGLAALIPLQRAAAADITAKVTGTQSVKAGTYNEWSEIRVDLTWKVASAKTGDTFTMPLDKMLDARRFSAMDLKDPAGAVVARATIKKDAAGNIVRDSAGNGVIVFTFTNYVATHVNLSGTAWFWIRFDHSRIVFPGTSTSMNTTIYGKAITITAAPGPVGNELLKYGSWRSPNGTEGEATALNPDGTSANPGADIWWTVQLQGGSSNRLPGWTKVTITDPAAPGWHYECPLTPAPSANMHDPTTPRDVWIGTSIPKITVTSCSTTSVTLTVEKAASDNNIYRVRFPGWINGAPLPNAYTNAASLKYQTPTSATITTPVSTTFSRSGQGGTGIGTTGPKIDIENYCTSWSGVVFVGGVPQLSGGQPTPQPPCDHDVGPGLKVATGASTPVTFRITNTGTETLTTVRVTDATTTGTALTNITCTFGGSTTMPFTGLAPGQSFLCTATLPPITAPHGNMATVTGIGQTSKVAVSDKDAWHATPISVLPPGNPKLTIVKRATVSVAKTGRQLKWRVRVKNTGAATAKHVKVCDIVRDNLAFESSKVTYTIGTVTRSVSWTFTLGKACFTIPSLGAGKTATITVVTHVPTTARVRVRNTATAIADGLKTVTANAKVPVIVVKGGTDIPSPTG